MSKNSICDVGFEGIRLKTGQYKRSCRYHRKQGQGFEDDQLIPPGCCPHLYRAAYPYSLSLLYNAKYPSKGKGRSERAVCVRCPSYNNNVEAEIGIRFSYPYIIRVLKNSAIRILQFLNIPAEYPDKNIILKVSNVKGQCPLGLKEGDAFQFNLKNRKELCPASFYNLYPALLKAATGAERNKKETALLHCPDPYGVAYYTPGGGIVCEDFFSIKAEVAGVKGGESGHGKGKSFQIEKMLPDNFCPLAFYSIFPYILTLTHGGVFEWVKKGEYVRVQCPKADGIIMEAEFKENRGLGDGKVEVRIVKILGNCPRGHKKGNTFSFDSRERKMPFDIVAGLVPFKNHWGKEKIYACPGSVPAGNNYRAFKIL